MTEKQIEALEKLNRGIQESRREVQQRTMSLAQDYFDDSAGTLEQQIKEDRAALESLPDQVPGGREEAFQMLFQELMDNYSTMEQCINEARKDVANLDTDQIRRQGEVEATDAARRQAREMSIDLTEVEGTGAEGRVTVDDVKKLAQTMEDGASEGAAQQAQYTAGQAVGQAQESAGQAADRVGQVAQGAQGTVDQAAGQIGQITDQSGGEAEEIDASDAAKREAKARGIDLSKIEGTGADGRIVFWDVTDAPPPAEGSSDPAGQAAQGASGAANQAGGAVEQTGGTASQLVEQAVSATRGTADQAGQTAQQGAGSVVDQAGQSNVAQDSGEESKATKAAKRKAEDIGADLSKIKGTGAGGLITISDVMNA